MSLLLDFTRKVPFLLTYTQNIYICTLNPREYRLKEENTTAYREIKYKY